MAENVKHDLIVMWACPNCATVSQIEVIAGLVTVDRCGCGTLVDIDPHAQCHVSVTYDQTQTWHKAYHEVTIG